MATTKDRSAPKRKFRLLDAMILVAATAAGCAMMQGISRVTDGEISWSTISESWEDYRETPNLAELMDLIEPGIVALTLTMPLLIVWTLALIPSGFISPRPRFRRLMRQPGMIVPFAVLLMLGLLGLPMVIAISMNGAAILLEAGLYEGLPVYLLPIGGMLVAASWMTLILGRRWRAEPNWIDRLGRALGTYWIMAGVVVASLWFIEVTNPNVCNFVARNIVTSVATATPINEVPKRPTCE